MNTFEAELAASLASGKTRLGSALTLADYRGGQVLAQVQLPPWTARAWTLRLLAQRYSSGPLVVAEGVNPDVQSASRATVRVEWGVDGGSEWAVVDYPASGLAMQVEAASVKVTLESFIPNPTGGETTNPRMGAFLAPDTRPIAPPSEVTLTTAVTMDAAQKRVSRPARACAYRLVMLSPTETYTVSQYVYNAGYIQPLTRDYWNEAQATGGMYWKRQYWTSLHPHCGVLLLSQAGSGNDDTVQVQWLLDL